MHGSSWKQGIGEAKLKVVLEKEDGQVVGVPIERLCGIHSGDLPYGG